MEPRRLRLTLVPEALAVCRLPADAGLPGWAWQGPLAAVSRTPRELTVVCAEWAAPQAAAAERGWRALRIEGVFDFAETGILASVAVPLADAAVGIFAFSTWETDYVLVRESQLEAALGALRRAGHGVALQAS